AAQVMAFSGHRRPRPVRNSVRSPSRLLTPPSRHRRVAHEPAAPSPGQCAPRTSRCAPADPWPAPRPPRGSPARRPRCPWWSPWSCRVPSRGAGAAPVVGREAVDGGGQLGPALLHQAERFALGLGVICPTLRLDDAPHLGRNRTGGSFVIVLGL